MENKDTKSSIINIVLTYLTKNSLILYNLGGINNDKTFDPSSGGIGIKLNTAITTLVFINTTRNVTNKLFSGDKDRLTHEEY